MKKKTEKPTPPKTKAQQALEKALDSVELRGVTKEFDDKVIRRLIRRAVKAAREEVCANFSEKLLRDRVELERLQNAHAVLKDREWFTLLNHDKPNGLTLHFCHESGTQPFTTIYKGDVVLIGRMKANTRIEDTAKPRRRAGGKK